MKVDSPLLDATSFVVKGRAPKVPMGVFWRPNATFVDELAAYCHGKRVLEVFAGNGFMAGLLAARGVEVTATSILSSMDAHGRGLFHPVIDMDAVSAVRQFDFEHDILLICWPTVTDKVLRCVQEWGKERDFIYIGEVTDYEKGHLGGCATDEFFASIEVGRRFPSYQGNALEQAFVARLSGSRSLTDFVSEGDFQTADGMRHSSEAID